MSKQFGRWQKAVAIVPLALLSAAWTTSLAGAGVTAGIVAEAPQDEPLPEGATVPSEAIEAPASVSSSDGLGLGVAGDAQQVIATASTNGIPAAALAAYQRAESVINSADKSCNLTWQLIAAIGRVESDHGRFGGNTLDDDGVAQPGIFGIALNGSNNTAVIRDTDAGQFDNDLVYDRAVGPLQFIPATWSVVGVDADGDGQRNPQDIDDASLGTAVYLCSGDDDLATVAGQRSAVYRYNHSQSYVDLVLSIMNAYLDGDFTSIPNNTSAAGILVPQPPSIGGGGNAGGDGPRGDGGDGGFVSGPTGGPETEGPDEDEPPGGGDNGGEPDGGDTGGDDGDGGQQPGPGLPGGGLPDIPDTNIPPVDDLLNLVEATLQCTLEGLNELLQPGRFRECLDGYMKP